MLHLDLVDHDEGRGRVLAQNIDQKIGRAPDQAGLLFGRGAFAGDLMALKMRKNRGPEVPEACPLLECTAIIGGAWTPNIIWYLR